MIINEDIENSEDFYENENKRASKMYNEKLVVDNNPHANKRKNFKNKYEEKKNNE
jgi:hypothetical protein